MEGADRQAPFGSVRTREAEWLGSVFQVGGGGSRDGSGVGFSLRRLIFGSLCKVKKTEVRRIWCLQVAEKGRRPASPCGGGLGTAQAQHNKDDRLPSVVVVWSRNLQPRLHANRAGGLPFFGGDVAREGDDGPRVSIGKDL
ncbi:hypothetical protein Taro_028751, partial [Colocasia esculenta]|nr:hypothetical protein [Colocasia esculenta]